MATRGIVLALWCAGLGLTLAGASAYLRVTGPSDLRFQPIHAPVVITPPPLPVPQPETSHTDIDAGMVSMPPPATNSGSIIIEAKSPESPESHSPYDNQNYFNNGNDSLITPQMMVPFFQGGLTSTNSPNANLSPSMWFKPPLPPGSNGKSSK